MDQIIMKAQGGGRIYLYPYGTIAMQIEEILTRRYGITNIIRIDNDLCKYNKEIIPIHELSGLIWNEKDVVLIASNNEKYFRDIRLTARKYVPEENIYDMLSDNPKLFASDLRIVSLAMVADEIYKKNISGAVAEAGVYKGDFAQHINMIFPDRRLYLFDSFEGFRKESVVEKFDNKDETAGFINRLKDTSVEEVMKKMTFPNQVIVKKGYIPETLKDVNETFAFVNLDMDLYLPIYEGLNFFWEKLSSGGYIFIHDFYVYAGAEKAVVQFCKEKKLGYIGLCDRCSVAIVKPID